MMIYVGISVANELYTITDDPERLGPDVRIVAFETRNVDLAVGQCCFSALAYGYDCQVLVDGLPNWKTNGVADA